MAKKADIHVAPGDDGRLVCRKGAAEPLARCGSKDEAMRAGREIAKADRVERVEHGRDGRIQDSDSFGDDPRQSTSRSDRIIRSTRKCSRFNGLSLSFPFGSFRSGQDRLWVRG